MPELKGPQGSANSTTTTPHQFIDKETEVMRGKAYTGGHRERGTAKQEPRAPGNQFGPSSIRPPCQAGILIQKW